MKLKTDLTATRLHIDALIFGCLQVINAQDEIYFSIFVVNCVGSKQNKTTKKVLVHCRKIAFEHHKFDGFALENHQVQASIEVIVGIDHL